MAFTPCRAQTLLYACAALDAVLPLSDRLTKDDIKDSREALAKRCCEQSSRFNTLVAAFASHAGVGNANFGF